MSHYKGDATFRPQYDDLAAYSSESEDDAGYNRKLWRSPFAKWVDEYYDVLLELYTSFKEHGQRVFGSVFHQAGNFSDFTYYVYKNTVVM